MEISIRGIRINYIVEGQGQPILVLHGWGASIDTVMPIVNGLRDRFQVHALDLPGFGASSEPLEALDSFSYADIVKEYIDYHKLEKLTLIGHSFGGKLSIILGSKYPDLIKKIILVNSAGLIPKRGPKYYIRVYSFKTLRYIYKNLFFWSKDGKNLESFYRKFGSTDYRDSSGIMRRILVIVVNENLFPILKEIKSPTLLIWGDKDQATPLYMGKIMEKEIKNSGLVVLEGGHYSYLDQYQRFMLIINNFLSS